MEMAVKDNTSSTSSFIHKEWISSRSAAFIDARKIYSDPKNDEQRKSLKRRLTKSLKKDREQWWIA